MNEIWAVFLLCHHLACIWSCGVSNTSWYLLPFWAGGQVHKHEAFLSRLHRSSLFFFGFFLSLIIFTSADLVVLLSSFRSYCSVPAWGFSSQRQKPAFWQWFTWGDHPLNPSPSPSSPARLGACYPASLRQLHWGLQDQLPCEPSWGFRALTLLDFICEWAFDLGNE